MKDKPNEWISIADLMAGVMAVLMLLLVLAVLQKTFADIQHRRALEQGSAAQRLKISSMLNELRTAFAQQGIDGLVNFDLAAGKITLRDNVFNRGSACVTPQAREAFMRIEHKIAWFLLEVEHGQVLVEGHTDNAPVLHPVIDWTRHCTVYDDNYTLSAARAREARKHLVGQLDAGRAGRIVVAGYGDSQPLRGVALDDARQRRVEVRFVVHDAGR